MASRRSRSVVLVLLAATSMSACFRAVIETGRPASPQVIDQPWAMGFVGGLVPPPLVETAALCPNGVAQVVTQHSFLNMLVSFVTFNIVSPMHITVTCAAGGSASAGAATVKVADEATAEQQAAALEEAGRLAAESGGVAYVQF